MQKIAFKVLNIGNFPAEACPPGEDLSSQTKLLAGKYIVLVVNLIARCCHYPSTIERNDIFRRFT